MRKPLRSKHCSVCDHCVALFDHHCPWVGNCVAQNNHYHFVMFLILMVIMQVSLHCSLSPDHPSPAQVWCEWGMLTLVSAGPCQCSVDAGLPGCLASLLGCHPSLVCMMAIMALTLTWNIALLVCQLYQVSYLI